MRNLMNISTIAILILTLPIAALADLSGTKTLTANTALSLDSGTTSSSGGDLLWNGTTLAPQGNASAYNFGTAVPFSSLTQTVVQAASALFSKSAISSLAVNNVLAVKTNGGNYSAVQVTAVSGGSITLQFTTFGASSAPAGPTITQVINNYGLIPAGFSNSGIAQGALFIIKGSGLADPNAQAVLQDSSKGLPTTLNGASVKVTVGGTTTSPVFYYAIAAQLALVLPSNTPTGNAQVTVTYNNQTSAPFSFQVVQSAVGLDSYYGAGSGLGVATNSASGVLYNYANSIPPGTQVTLWGSGLGADPTRDTTFSTANIANIKSLAHVYVGGVDAVIGYQGPSGYPGLNQVNITIPTNAQTGCNVSLIGVTTSGAPTNSLTLPIGTGACSDTQFGNIGSTLSTLSGKTDIYSGTTILSLETSPASSGSGTQVTNVALGTFQHISYNGLTYGTAGKSVSLGGCIVSQSLGSSSATSTSTGLDAGTITVTGPAGSATLTSFPGIAGTYLAQLASGFIPTSGGTFTFQNGSGGKDVGPFNAQIVFPTPLLTWTNQTAAATVSRSAGLPITWNGGSSGTFVYIGGSSSGTVNGQSVSGSFTCFAPQSAFQFTVPSYILASLPAGTGSVIVGNYTNYQSFSATGLDVGAAIGFVAYDIDAAYN
jgi:uncharacterized protein (TIGR03437 family)